MKKITTVALAGLVAVSSAASASQARWNGFGASSLFVADVQDMWTLPAVVASNKDASYFEFGTPAGLGGSGVNDSVTGAAWGGSHLSLGPVVVAVWGNRPYRNFGLLGNMSGAFARPSIFGTNLAAAPALVGAQGLARQLDLIVAFSLGEGADIGVGINTASAGSTTELSAAGTVAGKNTVVSGGSGFGINIGADLKELGPIALLEIGLQYDSRSDLTSDKLDVTGGTTNGTNKNTQVGSDINLRIGGDIKGDGGKWQRFEVGFGTATLEAKSEGEGAVLGATPYTSLKRMGGMWGLGWAMGMSNDKGLGLGGFVLSGGSTENSAPFSATNLNTGGAVSIVPFGPALTAVNTEINKNSSSVMTLNFVSGGEAKLKDWLAARAGFSTVLFGSGTVTNEQGNAAQSFKSVVNTSAGAGGAVLSTGASLMFGDITLDGTLNQDFLYSGPFFTNGIAEQLFGQVSATWGWGGSKE